MAEDLWSLGFGRSTRMDPESTLEDYWHAPGSGPMHPAWCNKPHRLLYDLIGEILHLRSEIQRIKDAE